MITDKIKSEMIQEAKDKHGDIYPCHTTGSFENSFRTVGNLIIFWFNMSNHSTSIITRKIEDE